MLGLISGGNSQQAGSAKFATSSSWTVPPGVGRVWVRLFGGGGGGTSPAGADMTGGNGGNAFVGPIAVTPATVIPITVGAGGTAGSGSGTAGAGGSSSFGSFCSTGGGTGSGPSYTPGISGHDGGQSPSLTGAPSVGAGGVGANPGHAGMVEIFW